MNTADPKQKKPTHPLLTASGLLGGVIGYYCGFMILIPLVSGMVALLFGKRFAPAPTKPFAPALAVIFGHMVWMLVAVMLLHTVAPVIADLIVMAAGLLWLALAPGLGPVIFLGIYEAISLVVNITQIIHFDLGSAGHKALTAHIALRLCALAALIAGYRELRKNQAPQSSQIIENPPGA